MKRQLFVRSLVTGVCAVLTAAVATPASAQDAKNAPQKANANNEVHIYVAALDSSGNPVKDLTKADWSVKEDANPRELVDAKVATDPMTIFLLVDNTKNTQNYYQQMRVGLTAFVDEIAAGSPESTITLISYGGQEQTLADAKKAGANKADLEKAISRISPSINSDALTLEALADVSKRFEKVQAARRVIAIMALEGTPEGSTILPQNVVNEVSASGAQVWEVAFRESGAGRGSQP